MARVEGSPSYQLSDNPQEACGVTAVFGKLGQDIAPLIPKYQDRLTNRGHDAAGGIVKSFKTQDFVTHKGPGRARDVFEGFDFLSIDMEGSVGIGHNRYQTSIDDESDPALGIQPIVAEYQGRKIAVAYNGNLPDTMRAKLQAKIPDDMAPAPADIDTYDIARAIISSPGIEWEDKFTAALADIPLAYSLTMVTDDDRVFGLRCPRGTWPLWFAEKDDTVIFASESRVEKEPDVPWQSVKPGELVEATPDGVKRTQLFTPIQEKRCSLNDLYGARFDSLFVGEATYADFRHELGRQLARELPDEYRDADAVFGIPESGLAIADGVAEELGLPAIEFIGKNKPASKTQHNIELTLNTTSEISSGHQSNEDEDDHGSLKSFIQKDQAAIAKMLSTKFDIPNSKLANAYDVPRKKVILTDETMIRGNTLGGDPKLDVPGVINLLRDNGVEKVLVAISASEFTFGCDQGYYIQEGKLVAVEIDEEGNRHILNHDQIASKIGADALYCLSIKGMKDVYEKFTGDRECACMACMGEPHPLDTVSLGPGVKPITLYIRDESNQLQTAAD